MRILAFLALFTALAVPAQAAALSHVRGSGVVNGNTQHAGGSNTGRFSIDVTRAKAGFVRYTNTRQKVVLRSTRITLFRDESQGDWRIVVVTGLGTVNGHPIKFYARSVDNAGESGDSFSLSWTERTGLGYWSAGGRLTSGNIAIR
ncbi:MAG: hypothetical protein M3R12_04890 [Actinomycetota bacterium]|nr:hypothetical protein [Actinomycetota bacterium]